MDGGRKADGVGEGGDWGGLTCAEMAFFRLPEAVVGSAGGSATSRRGFGGVAAVLVGSARSKSGMDDGRLFTEELKTAIIAAGAQARIEMLQAGVPVFYKDFRRDIEIMEMPDGRKFEIRHIPGAPAEKLWVIRQLDDSAV